MPQSAVTQVHQLATSPWQDSIFRFLEKTAGPIAYLLEAAESLRIQRIPFVFRRIRKTFFLPVT